MYTLTVTSTLCSRYKHRENKLPSNSSSPAPLRPALLQPLPPSPPSSPPPTPLFFLPPPPAPHGGLASVDLLWISQECGFIRGASNALFISKVARRASIETCCEPAAQKKRKKQQKKANRTLRQGSGRFITAEAPPLMHGRHPRPTPPPSAATIGPLLSKLQAKTHNCLMSVMERGALAGGKSHTARRPSSVAAALGRNNFK